MTREDYLYLCAIEECGEVAQALSKASRFGIDNSWGDRYKPNRESIQEEFNHLLATLELLIPYGVSTWADEKIIADKKAKVEHWLAYSKERDKVTDG
jgi:NTP pyrophosphatase (non-canonical NTP hydrolase)